MREVLVVGGGISGLTAAWRLAELGFQVEVCEAGSRWGGLIQTVRTPYGTAETAIHSWLETPAIAQMLNGLGVERVGVRPQSRARWVYRNGRSRRIPLSTGELFRALRGLLTTRGLAENPVEEEQTLAHWGERFLGVAGVEYALNPMLRGIYAARPEELGLLATFPHIAPHPGETLRGALRRRHPEGKRQMMAAAQGSQAMIDTWVTALSKHPRVSLRLNQKVETLPTDRNVILTGSAGSSAQLLEERIPAVAKVLHTVKYLPLVTVTVFVDEPTPGKRGVGILFPEKENRSTLGILFNSDAFPGRVTDESRFSSFTCILGGSSQPEVVSESVAQIDARIQADLTLVLGHSPKIRDRIIQRWPQALPLYSPQLRKDWSQLAQTLTSHPGVALFGNYTGQISVRGLWQQALAWQRPEEPLVQ